MIRRSQVQNLSPRQRTDIRHNETLTDANLARKYGVTGKTIRLVRATGLYSPASYDVVMATKKAAPKKRATKKKAAAPVEEPKSAGPMMPEVLGGPDLPRPLR